MVFFSIDLWLVSKAWRIFSYFSWCFFFDFDSLIILTVSTAGRAAIGLVETIQAIGSEKRRGSHLVRWTCQSTLPHKRSVRERPCSAAVYLVIHPNTSINWSMPRWNEIEKRWILNRNFSSSVRSRSTKLRRWWLILSLIARRRRIGQKHCRQTDAVSEDSEKDPLNTPLFRIIFHENGYTTEECLRFKPVIYSNTIQSMLAILHAMNRLRIPFEDHQRQVLLSTNTASCQNDLLIS